MILAERLDIDNYLFNLQTVVKPYFCDIQKNSSQKPEKGTTRPGSTILTIRENKDATGATATA